MFVYILKSAKTGRYYIGSTNDLDCRLTEHNSGKTISLPGYVPLELVFTHFARTSREAREIERKLKLKKSRVIIDKIVKDQKILGL
ncbi:MAG TPA: GIY-YIG nuclease family protein [Candidatus Paceibacterota bacterium]